MSDSLPFTPEQIGWLSENLTIKVGIANTSFLDKDQRFRISLFLIDKEIDWDTFTVEKD